MIRHTIHGQVGMGQWKEFYDLYERLEEMNRAKGYPAQQLWGPVVGTINAFMLVVDYDTIQAFHDQERAFHEDADHMKVWRAMGQLALAPPTEDLWETAFQIA